MDKVPEPGTRVLYQGSIGTVVQCEIKGKQGRCAYCDAQNRDRCVRVKYDNRPKFVHQFIYRLQAADDMEVKSI